MRVQRMVVPLSLALVGLGGCNVYETWSGEEFNAGGVNGQNFPPDYLGAGANRLTGGSGTFTARSASVGGAPAEYFIFPFSTPQRTTPATALNVAALAKPNAYVFDAGCAVPPGYTYDNARDAYDSTYQGVIFSALPVATYAVGADATWSYVPLVSRVKVSPQGVGCQVSKSEANLTVRKDVALELTKPAPVTGKQFGVPEADTYDAFAIIEPGAAVYRVGQTAANSTGIGPQKWGWYNQYILAYIDGGQVPLTDDKVKLRTQKLYYPRSAVTVAGRATTVTVGQGYDVLEARRGEAGYSPVCEVVTYAAPGALTPDQLPKSAAEVVSRYGTTLAAPTRVFGNRSPVNDPYVYCLQTE